MKRVMVGLMAVVMIAGCSKKNNIPYTGTASMTVNGIQYNMDINSIQVGGVANSPNIMYSPSFSFRNSSSNAYINFNLNTYPNSLIADSVFNIKASYFAGNYIYPIGFIGFLQDGINFNPNEFTYQDITFFVSKITSSTMDGTFSGKYIGTNSTNGQIVTDSITNGTFTNVPYTKTY